MSDSRRTDTSRALEPASDADREAKIEQLLLGGLDHYFAARYEHAINIWTRALFFDRSHARARAYIERARSALAEGLRESEELLQNGVAAFTRGESVEARRLLQAAIEKGAPAEEALAILDRLDRLESGLSPSLRLNLSTRRASVLPDTPVRHGPSVAAWVAVGLLTLVIVAAAVIAAGAFRSDWRALLDRPVTAPSAPLRAAAENEPALPRRGETALLRARALVSSGRLLDALAVLDHVALTDAQKADADRLRTDVQKQLIALELLPPGSDSPRKEDARQP